MVGDAPGHLLLKLPPVPPPAPPVPSFGPPALRLRTRGRGGIQQLDGHSYGAKRKDKWDSECTSCHKLCNRSSFNKLSWKMKELGEVNVVWCPECYKLHKANDSYTTEDSDTDTDTD
jgi:hypothetical protein